MSRRFARSERRGTPADLLVVGLGNPGPEFEGSLHNAGSDAVELLAARHGASLRVEKGVAARFGVVTMAGRRVALAVPTTFMNESGVAVRSLVHRFGITDPATIVIVHDELDLPPGTVRLKSGGGLAGHNGLRSVESHLHSNEFLRVRIGVGKPPVSAQGAAHVLRRPLKAVREVVQAGVETAADSVERIATNGLEAAMLWCHSLPTSR